MAEGDQARNSDVADVMSTSSVPGTSIALVKGVGGNVELNVSDQGKIEISQTTLNVLTPRYKGINYEKLIQICNDNTKKLAAIDILGDFTLEKLQQPDFEVYPQMRKGDVYDYYKGNYRNNQLIQEVGFLREGRIRAGNIGISDVVASICQKKKLDPSKPVGITAIVASAGSGKSTLTRRIASRLLGVTMNQVEDSPSYGKRMVHYIELKDMEVEDKIKPSKFLFGGLYENEIEEDQAFKWLDENQSEAVLIFDGLDQARWDFDENDIRQMRKHEKASSWTVMYNILSRNILRHVKVYIASREFKISELPGKARPETIITLNGLTLEDAKKLFVFLLGKEGESLWQKIETMSPILLNLVLVPVFLILTAVVMGRDPSKPPPTTVTELYNRIILALQSVETIRNREQILSIVNKLKVLAFKGMKEGRVVFNEADLNLFGVSAKEAQDLMTKVPGNNLLSRHLMQGDFTFFFCHQSIQEYLAAIFIAEMEFNEFSRFDEEHLHELRWSVVQRFVAGVVFSKSQNDLYKVSDQAKKRKVLARSICSQFEKLKIAVGESEDGFESYLQAVIRHYGVMEIFEVIYESDDDDLVRSLDYIVASRTLPLLSRAEAHVVGTLVARSQGLEALWLENGLLLDKTLEVIARCIKEPVHVKRVSLRTVLHGVSANALRSFLGHPRIEALSGNLHWEVNHITREQLMQEKMNFRFGKGSGCSSGTRRIARSHSPGYSSGTV